MAISEVLYSTVQHNMVGSSCMFLNTFVSSSFHHLVCTNMVFVLWEKTVAGTARDIGRKGYEIRSRDRSTLG